MSMKMAKLVLAIGAMAMAGGAMAASAQASATATVVSAIQISKDADLVFGQFIADPNNEDQIDLDVFGNRTTLGSYVKLVGGPYATAVFTVTGTANTRFSITLPGNVNITSSTNEMTVSGFVSFPIGGTSSTSESGVLKADISGASVTQKYSVGAKLRVAAAQAPGNYSGSFTVSVDYQ